MPKDSTNKTFNSKHNTNNDFEFLFTRSIEFRQETIYFIIVDRFFDGDPRNNEGPNPKLYDPNKEKWGLYWGGDLQGIIDQLGYLKNMGITAIWMTPLFEQIEEELFEMAPIHGYWAKDFKRLNPRLVDKDDEISLVKNQETVFDKLVAAAHDLGIKIILDIVCNHSSPDAGGKKGQLFDDGVLIADFHNDVNDWYHHYGEVEDWDDKWQVENRELGGLADFNENNSDYRDYIKSAIKLWLDRGVDALRIDTIKHMPLWFWQEFYADIKSHKPSVFVFGEWIFSGPYDGASLEFANKSGMSMLDFGFCVAIRRALGKCEPGGFHIIQEVLDQDNVYNSASELVTFIDNHDIPRFQNLNPDPGILRLAINLIMTSRGIPCIYYGTEQYLYNDTDGGEEPYNRPMMEKWDIDTPIYRDVQLLSKVRRINPAVSLGSQWQKYITEDVYCYVRCYRDYRCFVAINRGDSVTIERVETDLEDGEYICILTKRFFEVKDGALHNLELGVQEMIVINYLGDRVKGKLIVRAQLNGVSTNPGEAIVVTGDCPELGNWDISKAYQLEYINSNTWFNEIPFNESAGKVIAYKYAIVYRDENGNETEIPQRENLVSRQWLLAEEGTVKWQDNWAY
ncbi:MULTISPECIES: alpha-amylase family glycosyl hydrolase [unclassified Okeania]|uniref:alpha-amylase family glycosyl hydrolase n=1 Tax=unclassified Okeania TaxID=2634635 RepID=UPI0013B7D2F4|nr:MULTISPECIES: alpha-amylase family glycosyl hydrolase [unclassified Okeania]NES78930.1 cyclomaltodextrin glucanotransferase [Okeania sp. SIO1H4]NET22498.1 cyclomaltodextrin glucanotransferase [Okeania sp. SIO1H5]NET96202.1 cyclomaltodextrin glucanotransferase [Okeania sp. SIO1H2]